MALVAHLAALGCAVLWASRTGYLAARMTWSRRRSRHSDLPAVLAAEAGVLELPAQAAVVVVVVAERPASWCPGRCSGHTHTGAGTGWYPYCLWNWTGGGGVVGGDTPMYLLSTVPHSSETRADWG